MLVAQSRLTLWPTGQELTRLPCPWDSPGNKTGVGCHSLLQGIIPTQGSNPGLLHCQAGSLPLAPPGKHPPTPALATLLIIDPLSPLTCITDSMWVAEYCYWGQELCQTHLPLHRIKHMTNTQQIISDLLSWFSMMSHISFTCRYFIFRFIFCSFLVVAGWNWLDNVKSRSW